MTYFVIRTASKLFDATQYPRVELVTSDPAEADAEIARLADELSPDYSFAIAETEIDLVGEDLEYYLNAGRNVIGVQNWRTGQRVGVLRRAEEDTYWVLAPTAVTA